jgi:hypothetical protein
MEFTLSEVAMLLQNGRKELLSNLISGGKNEQTQAGLSYRVSHLTPGGI